MDASTTTGYVNVGGHRTWYRIEGDLAGPRPPLVVLHGGPGLPHNYLEPLGRLSEHGRAVVFYDQLGCGNSDRPDDDDLWTMETFEVELDSVRAGLGLERFHLFGHSWGRVAGAAVCPGSSTGRTRQPRPCQHLCQHARVCRGDAGVVRTAARRGAGHSAAS